MDYKLKFYIDNKLGIIEQNLIKLENYNYNTENMTIELEKLKRLLSSSTDIPNSLSDTAVQKMNNSLVSLKTMVDSLNQLVNEFSSQFKIFEDAKKIRSELNNSISKSKLNQIVELILNDSLSYRDLYLIGYKTTFDDELYLTLYEIIKTEYRVIGYSNLLNAFLSNKMFLKELKQLIDEDVKKNIEHEDVLKRYNEKLSIDSIDKTMVYLLAFNEGNYKKTRLEEIIELKKERDLVEKNLEYEKKLKKLKSKNQSEVKEKIQNSRKKIIKTIIPPLLSITMITSMFHSAGNFSKKHEYYKTTCEVYDTIDGYDKEIDYERLNVGDVIIEKFGEVRDDGYRQYESYVVENDGRNIEEYIDYDVNGTQNIELNNFYVNTKIAEKSLDEFTKISVVKDVNYADTEEDELTYLVYVGYIILWFLNDVIASMILINKGQTGALTGVLFNVKYSSIKNIKEEIEKIRKYKEELNIKVNGSIYDSKRHIQLKKQLQELDRKYNMTLKNYTELEKLLEYNNLILKR